MTGSIVCGLFKFGLALLLPASLGFVVDYVFVDGLTREEKLVKLTLVVALLMGAFLLRVPATYFRSWFAMMAGNRTIFDIRRDLYRHLQRLSLSFHGARRTGATISRLINDINASQGILDRGVMSCGIDIIFLVGTVAFLVVWDWQLALVSLLTLPMYGAVFGYINPKLRVVSRSAQEEISEMSGEVTEKLAGLPVVLSFAREKSEELRFFQRHRRYLGMVVRRERLKVLLTTASEFLSAVGPIVVIVYGSYRVIDGTLSVGQLIAFNGFLAHLYLPTRRLADVSSVVQEQLAAIDRVFALLDAKPEIQDAAHARPLLEPAGRVAFRHVTFGYNPDTPVLFDIDFEAEPGEAIALVGRSGAGKSTLISLVPRFYDVQSGAVEVDRIDVRDVTLRSLRENVGLVLQDTILFSGTIRENILYGRHNASETEMRRAAAMAHVDEFVQGFPRGFDTIIGERGLSLSGGQKQRISIARAFLRDPRILILDEATSNLDSHAEHLIQDSLAELMRGRTTLVIAHRLSTIVDCDRVLVMDHGRIVQMGTHDELIRSPGLYRALCEEQFGYIRLDELAR